MFFTHKITGRIQPHFNHAFLACGDFHERLQFACSTIPEEKWGLLVIYPRVGFDSILFNLFFAVVLYATTAVYFAGVMVRLMLTLTPVVCILAAVAFSKTLDNYLVEDRQDENKEAEGRDADAESSEEESDKKKRKDLYDKVHL